MNRMLTVLFLFCCSSFAVADELTHLIEYGDIAVIQRKGLPKTGRFEIHGGLTSVLNDAFFESFGFGARLNYSFVEQWALEFNYMSVSPSARGFTSSLESDRGILASSRVVPLSFVGASIRYTPFYGKLTFLDDTIIPFDLYFSLGGVRVGTNQNSEETGAHLGIGQIFSLNKDFAFRWDFSYYYYAASFSIVNRIEDTVQSGRGNFGNLYLSLGFSYFFPEAPYR